MFKFNGGSMDTYKALEKAAKLNPACVLVGTDVLTSRLTGSIAQTVAASRSRLVNFILIWFRL